MSINRDGDYVARSAYPYVGDCCCGGGCYTYSDTLLCTAKPGDEWRRKRACVRALVWRVVRWDGTALSVGGVVIAPGHINPDFRFRIADCSASYSTAPIVTRCWNLNPVTGLGTFTGGDCLNLSAAYQAFADAGAPAGTYALCVVTDVVVWARGQRESMEFGPVASIDYIATMMWLSAEEVAEWQALTFSAIPCE